MSEASMRMRICDFNEGKCDIASESPCDSCGTEACNEHGHWRGNDADPVFLCLDCEGEADKEVMEDHGPARRSDEV